jgi:hypothetical protein
MNRTWLAPRLLGNFFVCMIPTLTSNAAEPGILFSNQLVNPGSFGHQ